MAARIFARISFCSDLPDADYSADQAVPLGSHPQRAADEPHADDRDGVEDSVVVSRAITRISRPPGRWPRAPSSES